MPNASKASTSRIANLTNEIAAWEAKALQTQEKLNEYRKLGRTLERDQRSFETLQAQLHSVDRSQNLGQDAVSIMERASVATLVHRDRARPMILGAVVGALAALGLSLFIDKMDDKLRSVGDFSDSFHEELLGVIPVVSGTKGAITPLEPNDSRHPFSESYRNLRSSLLFRNWGGKKPKTILITSALPTEGKTTVATNLAITMALAGSRTLLIDADLRRGSLSKQFGISKVEGLGEIIEERLTLTDCAISSPYPNLAFLTRGMELENWSEGFLSPQFGWCLDQAAHYFDFVIIDSAPVLVADDTTTLSPLVDSTLFVMRLNATPARLATRALDQLYDRQVRVGGVVLNCNSVSAADYRSYGYYNYYSRKAHQPLEGSTPVVPAPEEAHDKPTPLVNA